LDGTHSSRANMYTSAKQCWAKQFVHLIANNIMKDKTIGRHNKEEW